MKMKVLFTLTLLNVGMLMYSLFHLNGVQADETPRVLRGRGLEIVDDGGRVRAEIKVVPAQAGSDTHDAAGGFPEAVQLRLITSQGAPNVKLVTTEDGAGQVLGSGSAYVQILARGREPFMKILNQNGKQQTYKP